MSIESSAESILKIAQSVWRSVVWRTADSVSTPRLWWCLVGFRLSPVYFSVSCLYVMFVCLVCLSVSVCICVCIYVCLYLCLYLCLSVSVFVWMCVCLYLCLSVFVFVCICVCLYLCLSGCVFVCICVWAVSVFGLSLFLSLSVCLPFCMGERWLIQTAFKVCLLLTSYVL